MTQTEGSLKKVLEKQDGKREKNGTLKMKWQKTKNESDKTSWGEKLEQDFMI